MSWELIHSKYDFATNWKFVTPVEETSALGRELILDLKILIPDLKICSPPNYFGLVHVYPLCAQTVFVKLYMYDESNLGADPTNWLISQIESYGFEYLENDEQ